jgi:hypothetical protein
LALGTYAAQGYPGRSANLMKTSLRFSLASVALLLFLRVSRVPLARPNPRQVLQLTCATNPLRIGGKRGFYTEGGQIDLRCVESGYAYNNNRLLAAEASPSEPWVDNEDIRVSIDLR